MVLRKPNGEKAVSSRSHRRSRTGTFKWKLAGVRRRKSAAARVELHSKAVPERSARTGKTPVALPKSAAKEAADKRMSFKAAARASSATRDGRRKKTTAMPGGDWREVVPDNGGGCVPANSHSGLRAKQGGGENTSIDLFSLGYDSDEPDREAKQALTLSGNGRGRRPQRLRTYSLRAGYLEEAAGDRQTQHHTPAVDGGCAGGSGGRLQQ